MNIKERLKLNFKVDKDEVITFRFIIYHPDLNLFSTVERRSQDLMVSLKSKSIPAMLLMVIIVLVIVKQIKQDKSSHDEEQGFFNKRRTVQDVCN